MRRSLVVSLLGVLLVVAHNALVTLGVGEAGSLAINLALASASVAVARRSGLTRRSLGLEVTRRGLAAAVVAAALTIAAVAAASILLPADTGGSAPPDLWFRLFITIPFGTALCEEVIFRGALLAALDRETTPGRSTAILSVLFGVWHVAAETARLGGLAPAILTGVAATAAASGLVLVPLRRWTGDLATPVAVHTATNVTVLVVVSLR